jgi:plastocyanin
MTRLLRIPVAVGLAAAIGLAGHSAVSPAAPTRTIAVKNDFFTPKKVTVARNTLVTWRWEAGSDPHNVVSRGAKRFKGSTIKSSGTHRVRFKKAGRYRYVCTPHEAQGMTGQIVVR